MATTVSSSHVIAARRHPGFATTLSSEWTKLRSVRSTWILTSLAVVLSVGISSLVALVLGRTFDTWSQADQAGFNPISSSMTGLLFSLILLIVLSVTAVSSEYNSGLIRTTFIVNPHRIRVGAAKAMVVASLGVAVHMVAVPGMFLASQAIYGAYGLDTATVTDSDAARYLLVATLIGPLTCTLIPLSLTYVLRRTSNAITAAIGFLFLPFMLQPVLPAWFHQHILRYLPDLAKDSLSGVTPPDAVTYLSPPAATVAIVSWIVGSLVAAAAVLTRRDV